jgi:large subunit ribosomal protein L5
MAKEKDAPGGKGKDAHGGKGKDAQGGKPKDPQGGKAKAQQPQGGKVKAKAKGDAGAKGQKADDGPVGPATPPRLRAEYRARVVPALMQRFSYSNIMEVPRLQKIVVNMGVGEAISNSKLLDAAVEDMQAITGQKPVVTHAKKSIANFKLREGLAIGCRVTLRGARMWEFYDRLVNVALPRIRDFRGVPTKSFDGRGNYTLGLKEQINFPEIDYDKIMQLMGMDITFVTTAKTDEESRELLALMNMPFRKP